MTARRSSKSLAYFVALATILTLVVPFAGTAFATHLGGPSVTAHDLEVAPELDTNPTGTVHTLTAFATGGAGTEVDFEIESGPAVTTCAQPTTAGQACQPTGPGQQAGGQKTTDADNSATSPDMTCVTDANGQCQVFFTSSTQGTNIIRAWVDDDTSNATGPAQNDGDPTETRYSGSASDCADQPVFSPLGAGAGTADPNATGNCATGTPANTVSEPDDTDVVEKIWGQGLAQACIDAEPETDTNASGTDHVITARVTSGNAFTGGDTANTFDCAGSVLANTQVSIAITDDTPNIFIKSVNGIATGGPSAGGPQTASGTTNASGELTVVIACVSGTPANCTDGAADPNTGNLIELSVSGAGTGPNSGCVATTTACDRVEKHWQQAGTQAAFDATPENDVNEVGQTHVITCRVTDAFGTGVSGVNCDAQVTAGPNADNNIGNDLNTTNGYVGQCTTGADGTCTISYTSSEAGIDQISVFSDLNANDTQQLNETGEGTVSDAITKEWVAAGQGTVDVDIDMENTAQGTANCDGLADGTDDADDQKTATNAIGTAHEICAERFGPTAERDSGPITFSITGPGTLFRDLNDNNVLDSGEPSGTSLTIQEEGCAAGFNCVKVTSTTAGTTNITACVEGSTTICDSATKTWTGGASRNILCTPETATNETGTTHEITCKVTDRFGNPVAGQTVQFTRTGPGEYASLACFAANQTTCNIVTNAAGEAPVRINTNAGEEGTTTVAAEIQQDVNDPDTQFDVDEACDQTAGNLSISEGDNSNSDTDNATPAPAGNCEDTSTKVWDDDVTECSDGVDNDGDGLVDLADDDCDNADDDTEGGGFVPRPCREAGPGQNVIVGTSGADVLTGTNGPDVICGAGGDDVISGKDGNDLIVGNGGNDTIGAGGGKDNAAGNGGDDSVSGNRGNDSLKGNAGKDALKGNAGIDTLSGGGGADTLQGGDGDDVLKGGDGNDTLRGGDGGDALDGGPGNDQCFGNAGNDDLKRCE